MRASRIVLASAALVCLAGVAYVGQRTETSAQKMVKAAQHFLGSLNDDQKKKALLAFDSKERFNWNFVPLQDKKRNYTRKGLPLKEMTADQKQAARALITAGTSAGGNVQANAIMALEGILHE